jgi:hypothetical protein
VAGKSKYNHGIKPKTKEYIRMYYVCNRYSISVEEYCENKEKYTNKFFRKEHLEYDPGTFEYKKSAYLKKLYGITLKEYYELLQKQDNKCAICGRHESKFDKLLSVDHDHKTGKVRGILCNTCNTSLGGFQDDLDIIQNAYNYIKKSREINLEDT